MAAHWNSATSNLTYWTISGDDSEIGTRKGGSSIAQRVVGVDGLATGKKYFEISFTPGSGNHIYTDIGLCKSTSANTQFVGGNTGSWGILNRRFYSESSNTSFSFTLPTGTTIYGILVDIDAGKAWWVVDGVIYGLNSGFVSCTAANVASGLYPAWSSANMAGATLYPAATQYTDGQTATLRLTADEQSSFVLPTGYEPWLDDDGGEDTTTFRVVHDLLYAIGTVDFRITQDHFYHLLAGFRQVQDHLYGLRMCIVQAHYFGNMPTFRRAFGRYYTNAPVLRKAFARYYRDLTRFIVEADRQYMIRGGLRLAHDLQYMIADAGFRAAAPRYYELAVYDRFRRSFPRRYAIAGSGPTLQQRQISVAIAGVQLAGEMTINVSALKDQDVIVGEVTTGLPADVRLATKWAPVVITVGTDVFHLVVSSKPRRLRTTEAADSWVITASSPAIMCDQDAAVQEFSSGRASAIAADLAAPYGVSVSWEIIDWTVPADTLFATNETPLAVIDKLAKAAGGIKQSAPDGTLRIIPAYPVSVNRWGEAEPSFIIADLFDMFSHSVDDDPRDGYNSFTVSNLLSSSANAWMEYNDLSGTLKEVIGYDVPWSASRRFSLVSTGGPWVTVEPMGVVDAPVEEDVELFAGVGKVSKPCYGLLDVAWKRVQLGALTYAEDGTVQSEVSGQSLATVRYLTRYWRWLARNAQVEDVQFVREVVGEQ